MTALALLVGAALAADPVSEVQPGILGPSAVHMEGGSGYLLAGPDVIAAWGVHAGAGVRAAWAPTDRLAVTAGAVANAGLGLGTLGIRYNVVERAAFALAPTATVVTGLDLTRSDPLQLAAGGLGVAVEGGLPRIRLDLSVPLLGTQVRSGLDGREVEALSPLLLVDGGVTFELGREDRDRLRLGYAGLPTISYRHLGERWLFEGMLGSALLVNATQVSVGYRF